VIFDDDTALLFSIDPYLAVAEGTGTTTTVKVTVWLNNAASETVSVDYQTPL